jgi:predicted transcriptional regulator
MSAVSFGQMATGLVGQIERGESIRNKVHARSYDENSPQADVFRPICHGDEEAFRIWRAQLLRTAEEFDHDTKEGGHHSGALGANGLHVLKVMLFNFLNYTNGACFPSISTISQEAKRSRVTVTAALQRLQDTGFMNWVRRTRKTGKAKGEGPQREQVSNAYTFVNTEKMDHGVLKEFRSRIVNSARYKAMQDKLKSVVSSLGQKRQQEATQRQEAFGGAKHASKAKSTPAVAAVADAMQSLGASLGFLPSNAPSASSPSELYPDKGF